MDSFYSWMCSQSDMKFVKLLETNQAAYIILTCFAEVYFILSLREVLGELQKMNVSSLREVCIQH